MGKFSKIMEKAGVDASYGLYRKDGSSLSQERSHQIAFSSSLEDEKPLLVEQENIQEEHWEERLYHANYSVNSLAEVFKTFRARILLRTEGSASAGTIMVTSAMPEEGKSFITANLSLAFASGLDQYVLLVDGDLRRPSIKKLFGRNEDFGLANYLHHRTALSELIIRSKTPKLSMLLAGSSPVNPAELLSSNLMKELIDELSARYTDRTIIFDSPPVLLAAEARMLAHHVDGVVLVVRQGAVGRVKIEEAINAIGPDRIIGIVFNDYHGNYFATSNKYGYGYRYE